MSARVLPELRKATSAPAKARWASTAMRSTAALSSSCGRVADHPAGQRRDLPAVALDQLAQAPVGLDPVVGRGLHAGGLRDDVAGGAVDGQVDAVEGDAVGERLDDELAVDRQVELRVGVPGDHDVDRVVHLARLVDDLALRVVALLERPRVGQHDDRLDALALELGHVAVDGVGEVVPAELAREAREQEDRRVGGRHADEADLDAGALDDLVGRQDQVAAVARDGVGGDVGVVRALDQPQRLVAALVELVVAERPDVEAHLVGRLDRGLVVPVARDQG